MYAAERRNEHLVGEADPKCLVSRAHRRTSGQYDGHDRIEVLRQPPELMWIVGHLRLTFRLKHVNRDRNQLSEPEPQKREARAQRPHRRRAG